MTPDNTYHRRGHDECRAYNKDARRQAYERQRQAAGTRLCDCGCGTLIPALTFHGKPARYVGGHHNRGKSNTWLIKDEVTARTSHERAAALKQDITSCEWAHIGGCAENSLEVAHVDGDEMNNDPG